MSRLKPSLVKDIEESFNNTKFTKEDFEIKYPEKGEKLIEITFKHKDEYSFIVSEITQQEVREVFQQFKSSSYTQRLYYKVFSVETTPGKYKIKESQEISDLGDALNEIPKWCNDIYSDLISLKEDREDEVTINLREKISEGFNKIVEDETGDYFSGENLNNINKKLDELYEAIKNIKEEYSLTKEQLSDISKEFNQFKENAKTVPKEIWAKVTANKFTTLIKRIFTTAEGRQYLLTTASHLTKKIIGN
jgi:hypothetical protein